MAQQAVQKSRGRKERYSPPSNQHRYLLSDLLQRIGRAALDPKQYEMLRRDADGRASIYYSGHLDLLDAARTCSIV